MEQSQLPNEFDTNKASPTIAQILLPQVAAYCAGALGFVSVPVIFVLIIMPFLEFWSIDIKTFKYQNYIVVSIIIIAVTVGIACACFCGSYVYRMMKR
jgi:predicted MFS family arabinose efflux permease